ncbi:MAG: hypothetical protein R2712_17900 [Vicinamibacterales bacterium]
MTAIPLRRRLLVLTAAGILPLAVVGGFGLYALAQQPPEQTERVGLELARSVANAVDAEFRRSETVLEILGTTPSLDHADFAAFRIQAERALATQHYWAAVVVLDPSGHPIFDTRHTAGEPLPEFARMDAMRELQHTRAPAVGTMARHGTGPWHFPVLVPVIRSGAIRFVLAAVVEPDSIRRCSPASRCRPTG